MKSVSIALLIFLLTGVGILFFVSSVGIMVFPSLATSIGAIFPKLPSDISQVISESIVPTPIPVTKDMILAGVNRVRLLAGTQVLKVEPSLCPFANAQLSGNQLSSKQILSICPNCVQLVSVKFDRRVALDEAIQYIEKDATASAMIKNKKLNTTCLVENESNILLVSAQKSSPPSPIPQRTITEDELYNAISDYRKAHGAKELNKDDKLCEYARKRVADHIKLLDSKVPKESYPIPAKYPLDGHEGFKKDADSGMVFEMTGRRNIAENLAYWPTAQYAVHVIEWGWDTSTEGHRETQLSNDFDAVCLSGSQGFFVATFGK